MTPKQERFVHEYLKDLNATQAATRAGYSAKTANEQGSRLLANASIREAISKAQTKVAKRAELTFESHLDELAKIRDAAFEAKQYGAATTAESLRGKAAGYYVERHEHEIHDLTHEEREERIRSILLTAKQRKMGQLPA